MSIVCVGGMESAELVELISNSPFAVNKPGARTLLPDFLMTVPSPSESMYVFERSKHYTSEEPHKVGGWKSAARIPGGLNRQAVRFIAEVLYRELFREIRESRSWTYGVDTDAWFLGDFWEFTIDCGDLPIDVLDQVEDVVGGIITSLGNQAHLFEQQRHRALTKTLMVDLSCSQFCGDVVNTLTRRQRIISLAEYREELEKVTMDDIRDVLDWLRREQRWTLIVKP